MPSTFAPSISKTPLDYIAEGYWQDFLAARPIAGGIAYEAQLQDCQLDETLASLQRIDTLITQIRRDTAKSAGLDETKVLADERYRNLLLFLAFYAGRVLARQWQQAPQWYGQFELRGHYPSLPLVADDFYQHMAVRYRPVTGATADLKDDDKSATPVFFALEPIGMRLFGHIDRQFQAVQGGQVASGLYQAVTMLSPSAAAEIASPVSSPAASVPTSLTATATSNEAPDLNQPAVKITKNVGVTPTEFANTAAAVATNATQQITVATDSNEIAATAIDATTKPSVVLPQEPLPITSTQNINRPLAADSASAVQPLKTLSKTPVIQSTPEMFTQLLTELDQIEVTQPAGNSDYQKARKILDQFERHIAKQDKPRAQVVFSESHQRTRQQALSLLSRAAALDNTAAMLRLAMYELLGEGLTADNMAAKETGVDLVKQAASKQDVRAQRLLSRMYYQGVGVPQDVNNGKHWLEKAADNGHTEAASLVAQWQQAQALITSQKQEQHSIKRYQLLIGVVVVGALLLIIFV